MLVTGPQLYHMERERVYYDLLITPSACGGEIHYLTTLKGSGIE